MKTPSPTVRKLVLVTHIATSVGALGAVASFLLFALIGTMSTEPTTLSVVYPMANLLAERIILPLLVMSLVVGILSGLTSPWGVIRYDWVLGKLAITAIATVVLLFQMHPIGQLAGAAQSLGPLDPGLRHRILIHAAGGFLVLLVPLALSVWKPSSLPGIRRWS